MIEPGEALEIVLRKTPRLEAIVVPLAEADGAVLAEAVASDADLPPFDKSAMDGFAVRAEDLARLPAELIVGESLPAGTAPARRVERGTCARIMTGAPVPAGADVVVRVEHTGPAAAGAGRVRILRSDLPRRNICIRGEDVRQGETVLQIGRLLGPAAIGLLASVGRGEVRIVRRPAVAVLATGDELVSVSAVPGPGQIRDANSWSLLACLGRAGARAEHLGVARDTEDDLRKKIARGMKRDVLLVSGGVSVGDWDLVPKVLRSLGVEVHFAAIRMKPGKPTLFGTHGRGLVFGLPGNPVSTLVAFHLFVWPALRKMMGRADAAPPTLCATLAAETLVRGERRAFLPAVLRREGETWAAEVIATRGSADLVGFSRAGALVALESGLHPAGTRVEAYPLGVPF
ncbi:MAG TPA: gephyrin-like molybdotransferase Glp [Phycisphaerae bacterium]|nr:gephyrin-like molybdotransferase Glp [Phycisphaerae bacterium]